MLGKLRLRFIDAIRGTRMMSALEELKQQQYLPEAELEKIRQRKTAVLFQKAHDHTTYYRQFNSWEEVPVLTKDIIRANTPGLISAAYKGKLMAKRTGGSTGTPLVYYTTRECQTYLWAGIILSWECAGYQHGDPVAFIAGTSLIKTGIAYKIFYRLFNIQVYPASPMNEATLSGYAEKIRKRKTTIIYGYANVINELANYIKTKPKGYFPHLRGIVCTAEVLKDNVRKNIEAAFGIKVYNQYGCHESGTSAFECEKGSMHLISSKIIYEFDKDENLICTDLANEGFIMLKYFTGDIIKLSDTACSCKRTFPVIREVVGRTSDIVVDKFKNRLHSSFFYFLFKNEPSAKKYQTSFDENSIIINVETDRSKPDEYYEQFLEPLQNLLKFDHYRIVVNQPFVVNKNGKHQQTIDNRGAHSA